MANFRESHALRTKEQVRQFANERGYSASYSGKDHRFFFKKVGSTASRNSLFNKWESRTKTA